MRFTAAFLSFLLLSGCATTTPTPAVSTGTRTPAPVEAPSRIAQALRAAGRADAPTQSEIERLLGAPDIARQDGAGAALTYRLDGCALLLVFAADQRNAMRLAEAHPGARRSGDAAPSLEQCAAEADAR